MQPSRTVQSCFVLAVLLLIAPFALAGGEVLRDMFSAGLGSHWTKFDEGSLGGPSNWQVVNGVLQQTTRIRGEAPDSLTKPGTYLLTGAADWTDYRFRVKMRTVSDEGELGLMFGYQDPGTITGFQ